MSLAERQQAMWTGNVDSSFPIFAGNLRCFTTEDTEKHGACLPAGRDTEKFKSLTADYAD
jgi:hypothetical protein